MPAELLADNLPVGVRRHPGDPDLYDWGVTYQGAFIPLWQTKSGRVDKWVRIAAEEAAAQPPPATQPSQTETAPPPQAETAQPQQVEGTPPDEQTTG